MDTQTKMPDDEQRSDGDPNSRALVLAASRVLELALDLQSPESQRRLAEEFSRNRESRAGKTPLRENRPTD